MGQGGTGIMHAEGRIGRPGVWQMVLQLDVQSCSPNALVHVSVGQLLVAVALLRNQWNQQREWRQ